LYLDTKEKCTLLEANNASEELLETLNNLENENKQYFKKYQDIYNAYKKMTEGPHSF